MQVVNTDARGGRGRLGVRLRPAWNPNQKPMALLPALGPGDRAAASQPPALTTVPCGSPSVRGQWGNLGGRAKVTTPIYQVRVRCREY